MINLADDQRVLAGLDAYDGNGEAVSRDVVTFVGRGEAREEISVPFEIGSAENEAVQFAEDIFEDEGLQVGSSP